MPQVTFKNDSSSFLQHFCTSFAHVFAVSCCQRIVLINIIDITISRCQLYYDKRYR